MKMESQIQMINVDQIIPNRFQPRLKFDDSELNDLAASIREHGIIQPLVLRRVGTSYEIIAGERRYKASQLVGLTSVPAIIAQLDDNESAEVAVIENTHRSNLSAIEEAKSYKKLLDRNYVTQDQLAKRLGTSQSTIANKLRLLNLSDKVQDALLNEKISERHARSLLKLNDKNAQENILNKVIEERWPVKRLDEEIDKILGVNTMKNGMTDTSNMHDIVVDNSIKDNHQDISSFINNNSNKKDSLFFNNLENESANMNTGLGFNPFDNNILSNNLLDIEDIDDDEDIEEDTVTKKVETLKIETREDVIKEIKHIISLAKDMEIPLTVEEFDFDKLDQFIIRIDK